MAKPLGKLYLVGGAYGNIEFVEDFSGSCFTDTECANVLPCYPRSILNLGSS